MVVIGGIWVYPSTCPRDYAGVLLKDGYDNLVNNLVEVFLLDTAETTLDITLDITRENLALYEAGLREGKAFYHIIGQLIGILRLSQSFDVMSTR